MWGQQVTLLEGFHQTNANGLIALQQISNAQYEDPHHSTFTRVTSWPVVSTICTA